MNKAFIFDMDGVIVDSESVWPQYEQKFFDGLLGKNTYVKVKDQILGATLNEIYEILCNYGLIMSKKDYIRTYDTYAKKVYATAKITQDLEKLLEQLISLDFKLGIVSSSRKNWINIVLKRLKSKRGFQCVLSLNDENIRPKPFPDGYKKAIETLKSLPKFSIVLEDTNRGIKSAKASGAFTICLKENLPKNYKPLGADMYVETIKGLIDKLSSTKGVV